MTQTKKISATINLRQELNLVSQILSYWERSFSRHRWLKNYGSVFTFAFKLIKSSCLLDLGLVRQGDRVVRVRLLRFVKRSATISVYFYFSALKAWLKRFVPWQIPNLKSLKVFRTQSCGSQSLKNNQICRRWDTSSWFQDSH